MIYQALLPQSQAQAQLSNEALMRQLLGVTGPSLASGETRIGR
jgi:hypothetical protein